jgi:hypothetical protein
MNRMLVLALLVAAVLVTPFTPAASLAQPSAPPGGSAPGDYILLTIFLRHDQSKTLDEINQQLDQVGFWAKFPPDGIAVESWYVMMGIGQVVTLRVPPARLREVNRAIEQYAWKAFRTEFYPTYDLREAVKGFRERAQKK